MAIMLAAGIVASLVFVFTSFLELRASIRRRRLHLADHAVTTANVAAPPTAPVPPGAPTASSSAIVDAVAIGGGATALSLYELYAAADDHADVLRLLQERFNDAIPADASPLDWLSYFGEKAAAGPHSLQGTINAMVGTLGEHGTLDYLNALPAVHDAGLHAVLFDSNTHFGTDIHFIDAAGHDVGWPDISVKSYADAHSFLSELGSHHQAATMVNHEVYEQLASSGKLSDLAAHGMNVYDGHFSHLQHVGAAHDTIGAVHDAADVTDYIPWTALAMFSVRTYGTVQKWRHDQATLQEAAIEVGGHGVRMATTGTAAVVGAKTGAIIGNAVAPGVGILIGGGLGAVLAALGAGTFISWLVDWFKYHEINDAVRAIGQEVHRQLVAQGSEARRFFDHVANTVFGRLELSHELTREDAFAPQYATESNVYAFGTAYRRPSPSGAMVRRHRQVLRGEMERCAHASRGVADGTLQLVAHQDGEIDYGFVGELAAANEEHFAPLLPSLRGALRTYRDKVETRPHHPYRLRSKDGEAYASSDVFAAICAKAYRTAWATPQQELALPLSSVGYLVRVMMVAALVALGVLAAKTDLRPKDFARIFGRDLQLVHPIDLSPAANHLSPPPQLIVPAGAAGHELDTPPAPAERRRRRAKHSKRRPSP